MKFNIVGTLTPEATAHMPLVSNSIAETARPSQHGLRLFGLYLLAFIGLLSSFYLSPDVIKAVCWVLVFWAFIGPKQSIQALLIGVLIKYLNPTAFLVAPDIGIAAWLILLVAALRNLPFTPASVWKKLTPVLVFSLFTCVVTFVTSSHVGVSLMKLLAFTFGVSTVLVATERLTSEQIRALWLYVAALFTAVVIGSLLTLPLPKIAYALNGTGFQGILNHPQSIGALFAPFVCWLLGGVFYQQQKLLGWALLLSVLLIALSILSQTRTAMAAVALSMLVTSVIFLVRQKRALAWGSAMKLIRNALLVLMVLTTFVAVHEPTQDALASYVFKRESQDIDQALSSRSAGITAQWHNFLERPVAGWGFGVYPGKDFSKDVHTFMGIPISAPVEKGFLPTAVLEEVGIIGAFAFLVLVVVLTRSAMLSHDIRWLTLFLGCLFVNVGESVFFSVGGIGLFYWLMMGLATVSYRMDALANPLQSNKQNDRQNKRPTR